jgi:ssDNA-binding Zn-finger/Zn-ribbon topoisomerase 1
MVYEVRELGTIVRCPGCDHALIRLAHNRYGRPLVDLRGTRYLATG